MSLFAIGDLHLSFGEGVDKPMDIYGGPWIRHTDRLQEQWEDLIGEDDVVLLPGDISWGMHLREAIADLLWIAGLPGKKVILKGNHDLWWTSLAKLNGIHESLFFLHNNCFEGPDYVIGGSRGWLCPGAKDFDESADRKIYERELIRLDLSLSHARRAQERAESQGVAKQLIGALHFPPTNERKQPSGFTDAFEKGGAMRVIYAHLHGASAYANGLSGTHRGVEYTLCSFDRLNGVPLRIL